MERVIPLRVRFEDPNTFHGPCARQKARRHAAMNGAAVFVHMAGGATLFYVDGEFIRQKSWARITIAEPLSAFTPAPSPAVRG